MAFFDAHSYVLNASFLREGNSIVFPSKSQLIPLKCWSTFAAPHLECYNTDVA